MRASYAFPFPSLEILMHERVKALLETASAGDRWAPGKKYFCNGPRPKIFLDPIFLKFFPWPRRYPSKTAEKTNQKHRIQQGFSWTNWLPSTRPQGRGFLETRREREGKEKRSNLDAVHVLEPRQEGCRTQLVGSVGIHARLIPVRHLLELR